MTTLVKALTGSGVGSRRVCFQHIVAGRVTVNGTPALSAAMEVDPGRDAIAVDGQFIAMQPALVYLKVHKPAGVLSAVSDSRGRPTVAGLAPPEMRHLRLFPVGRLDMDSTGLMLLTNDGDLAHRLMHPRFGYEKEYHIRTPAPLTDDDVAALAQGIQLDGKTTAPASVAPIPRNPGHWYAVTLAEGRKRQVRRMLAALGKPPEALQRVRIHTLRLADLAPGRAVPLSADELAALTAPVQPSP